MSFPTRLLGEDEQLILDMRPHWLALVGPGVAAILIIAAIVVANAFLPSGWPGWVRLLIVLAGLVLLVAKPLRRVLAWATSELAVTSDRIVHRSGWLTKRSMEIPLEQVTDVRTMQTPLERIVGSGSVLIESPGEEGEERFSHVANPENVERTIQDLTHESRKRMAPVTPLAPVPAPSAPSYSVADELAKLARLRQQGVLTDEEFQAQKARLLEIS